MHNEIREKYDEGKIKRLYNGVYYIHYTSILGTEGKVSIKKFIEKRYLSNDDNVYGYYTGITLANMLGFTTQNPACYEICSNAATTKQRKLNVDGVNMIVYKPLVNVTKDNYKELQFLDLMINIDKYSELNSRELIKKLKDYVNDYQINFKIVKEYLGLYPDKFYRNIYNGGLMNELV